jgi:hypothetical protein
MAEGRQRRLWMYEAEGRGGIAPHAYKHRRTRRYLSLTEDGRTFAYRGEGEEGKRGIPGYTDDHGEGDGLDAN